MRPARLSRLDPPARSIVLALVVVLGCAAPTPGPRPRPATAAITTTSPPPARDPSSVGSIRSGLLFQTLRLQAGNDPPTEAMEHTLERVVLDAADAIRRLGPPPLDWDRAYIESVLRRIDATLIDHGFVYPHRGGVDDLVESLKPFAMSARERGAFERHPHNRRRVPMMARRYPGPFHRLDCDTASLIYLGIAEHLDLPLHLVVIPSLNRRLGHTFVRWRQGSRSLNWETNQGTSRPDADYVETYGIPRATIEAGCALVDLTPAQALSCVRYVSAVQFERRGDHARALAELERVLETFPAHLDARRQFAWITATAPDLLHRDHDAALRHASYVRRVADDPDIRDTLAAVHASAGQWEQALGEQRAALSSNQLERSLRPAYRHRLQLYQAGSPYRRPPRPAAGSWDPPPPIGRDDLNSRTSD